LINKKRKRFIVRKNELDGIFYDFNSIVEYVYQNQNNNRLSLDKKISHDKVNFYNKNKEYNVHKLIDPPNLKKEKKFNDNARKGNWERIKDTFVTKKPKLDFDDIGGCDEAKNELRRIIAGLKKPNVYKKYGSRLPRGILIYGPPGNGKTMLVKATAFKTNVKLFIANNATISSKWVGELEGLTNMLFELIKANTPCILLLDEIDSMVPDRSNVREWYQRVVSIILGHMDGITSSDNLIVIGTTNLKNNIDPALLRPGRFDKIIRIDKPDKKARKEIFKIHCKDRMVKDIDYDLLAEYCEGFSGADIEAVILLALQPLIDKDLFSENVENVENTNLKFINTNDILFAINSFKKNRGFSNNDSFSKHYVY
jgi:transitional endoplasmic reticulum ATPase